MPLDISNLERNKPLAPYTTYKIGGLSDFFVEVHTIDALLQALFEARRNNIPFFLLGCGANILVTDKGFRGLVIHNLADTISFFNNDIVVAESGATVANLIEQCRDRGLSGFEHFVGIPSTVGGAVWQNLHFLSPDRQRMVFVEEIVRSGRIFTEEGHICTVGVDYFQFGYDKSILQKRKDIVLDITFQLLRGSKEKIQAVMDTNMAWRNDRQPQLSEFPSCGSVFKKIKDVGAGRLIEQAGLKGERVGEAEVSKKHANFIINRGNATAYDVLQLIQHVRNEVKRKLGYNLEMEITIVGEL
ncbi:UDP-N-acetylenolpyruvoylglucosamine reductase MurB [Candidatus Brocadiaceae bacterium B188]|jgi:UDP-N-acetylmuramate dehydrogenase|nr:UDP-N-acetylmuramate dehydrogenase [Candidatus Brocadia sapporoensis]MEB2308763.1 UDP-N-acetylmuramate dehydrogenase [Candidatus Brocadiaceae bacterium]OQZ02054.1 MAG: UDP-N-acetylenolpyruvoylglucosamine reductase [Candidatus Brocadia sp. UTAMX1]QQR65500.1 MAG: UDP-N-acetylmuramate dehydrogenase [Candidatus Brocadia sp.]RZV57217.1 MAG: UDP-N-acetylmuramate dehydrogenase [Candidatus Brocadia sp. BROELEC01]TWU50391.1 UDP-N-acetylenolpyruvoylglucosamine reductase MurB [Candidatus Brocadiaceae 